MDEEALFFPTAIPCNYSADTDVDFSFTSCASTDRTTTTSARTSLARSSLTLSFNDRLSLSTTAETFNTTSTSSSSFSSTYNNNRRSSDDPHWSAIKAATTISSDGALHLRHLKLLRHLGTGNLGRVFLCRLRDYDDHANNANFALKVVDKESLSPKKLSHVKTEAEILSTLDHPFLPTLYAHIEVSHYTCLLIDYCPGGDLHALLRRQHGNRLPLKAVKFFTSEVLVALEYLHSLGIVYRDLKPENILLREDGHIMLSDFDLCFKADVVPTVVHYTNTKRHRRLPSCFGDDDEEEEVVTTEIVAEPTSAFSRSCVGTHEYLAPELVAGNGHGNGVDWWAFGVLIYELAYGTTPFKGGSKDSTLRNIASTRDVRFPKNNNKEEEEDDEEEEMSLLRDLVEKLLVKDPRRRLGCARGAADVKRHPFFKGIKWALIRNYKAPELRGLSRKTTMAKMHVTSHKRRRLSRWLKNLKGSMLLGCYKKKKPCRFLHV